jgi:tripartite-type tricarboxylate transporter receptor subunit TctC
MLVAVAPGGGTDIIARLVAARLTESVGQTIVVDNRSGGSSIIGTTIAAKALPDGYTLLLATNASHAINPGLFRELPYDPIKDFTPIVAVAGVPTALVVTPAFPAQNLKDFIAYGVAQNGKLNHGSSGTGGTGHLTAEIFKAATGMQAEHVPYKSDGPALVDLLGGQLSFMFPNMPAIVPYVKAGRLHALAVTSARRSSILPEVPTLMERGIPLGVPVGAELLGRDYSEPLLLSLAYAFEQATKMRKAPLSTPKEVLAQLNGEVIKIFRLPDLKERLAALGLEPAGAPLSNTNTYIKSEIDRWARVVNAAKITVE